MQQDQVTFKEEEQAMGTHLLALGVDLGGISSR